MSYTDQERSEAITLALSTGSSAAASKRLGIPKRTVNRWVAEVKAGEGRAARILPPSSRKELADRLWEVGELGVSVMAARITDPDAKLGDITWTTKHAFEMSLTLRAPVQRTLPDGTVETIDYEEIEREQDEDRRVLAWLDQIESASDQEIAEYLASGGLTQIRDASKRAADG